MATSRDAPPSVLVPDTEFAERGGLWAPQEEPKDRTLHPVLDVILVRPTLSQRPRAWTFQIEGLPEFSATMKDRHFLSALATAHVRESLRTGIPMKIRMEIKEQYVDGEWRVKRGGRSVIEVLSPKID